MAHTEWIHGLEKVVGADHVISGSEAGTFAVDGKVPRAVVFPRTVEETSSVMAIASEAALKTIPWGAGSQMALGAIPARVDLVVALKHLNHLVDHEWGDMTATVQGGMRLEDFQQALAMRVDPAASFTGLPETSSSPSQWSMPTVPSPRAERRWSRTSPAMT
jgi:FAD/FMN-containing dehydrogenase